MTTTEHLQRYPDTYASQDEADDRARKSVQTNTRYKLYRQTHFTAGDEDQFETYRDARDLTFATPDVDPVIVYLDKRFQDTTVLSARNTFRYLFHKFKKAIFIQVRDNKVNVMLPFSKHKYTNEWTETLSPNPDVFSSWNELYAYTHRVEGHRFNPKRINQYQESWYSNNAILRNEFPVQEHDTGVAILSHLFHTVCQERTVPDLEFFVHRRDYPVLTRDGTESYTAFFGENTRLQSHAYSSYAPLFSMCSTDRHADILIPTTDDWVRVCAQEGIYFPRGKARGLDTPVPWSEKQPRVVFRGSSTGYGITPATNQRVHAALLAQDYPDLMDVGLTHWNMRPRKIPGKPIVDTFHESLVQRIPLVNHLSLHEQATYKFILHIDGHVAAYRLASELSTGSVVLKVDSPYRLWYTHHLVPYTHYVPIAHDLSNLIPQVQWCMDHDDECQRIADAARLFYDTHLSRDAILNYMCRVLTQVHSAMTPYAYSSSYFTVSLSEEEKKAVQHSAPPTPLAHVPVCPSYPRTHDILFGVQCFMEEHGTSLTTKQMLSSSSKSQIHLASFAGMDVVRKSHHANPVSAIHETFIGTQCVNDMMKYLPHFAYTFGMFDGDVVTEYVPGETLFDWIASDAFTMDRMLHILLQIGLALHEMQQMCSFTHYDLRPWNVVLSHTPQTVDYVTHGTRLSTDLVPVMLDYGSSYAVVDGQHHGTSIAHRYSSVFDILTILLTSVHRILQTRRLPKADLSRLFKLTMFFSGTEYTQGKHFSTVSSLRRFLVRSKSFAALLDAPKRDLEGRTPRDFIAFLTGTFAIRLPSFATLHLPMRYGSAYHVVLYLKAISDKERLDAKRLFLEETKKHLNTNTAEFGADYVATYLMHACETLHLDLPLLAHRTCTSAPVSDTVDIPPYPPLTDADLERPDTIRRAYATLPYIVDTTRAQYHLYAYYKLCGRQMNWPDVIALRDYIANKHLIR